MIDINFIPIFNDKEFITATEEYETIWAKDGEGIFKTLESITDLKFKEDRIAVLVYEGISYSGRNSQDIMRLRASYDSAVKKGTLVHELSHRLLFGFKTSTAEEDHLVLNLFLYDSWITLYGIEFADMMVAVESKRTDMYKNAWEHTLQMTDKERREEFSNLKQLQSE